MQWLIAAIWAAFSRLVFSKIGRWVVQLLIFLGIGLATKEFALDPLLDYVESAFSGMPALLLEWIGFFGIDIYVVAVLSAYAAAAVKEVFMKKLATP